MLQLRVFWYTATSARLCTQHGSDGRGARSQRCRHPAPKWILGQRLRRRIYALLIGRQTVWRCTLRHLILPWLMSCCCPCNTGNRLHLAIHPALFCLHLPPSVLETRCPHIFLRVFSSCSLVFLCELVVSTVALACLAMLSLFLLSLCPRQCHFLLLFNWSIYRAHNVKINL